MLLKMPRRSGRRATDSCHGLHAKLPCGMSIATYQTASVGLEICVQYHNKEELGIDAGMVTTRSSLAASTICTIENGLYDHDENQAHDIDNLIIRGGTYANRCYMQLNSIWYDTKRHELFTLNKRDTQHNPLNLHR